MTTFMLVDGNSLTYRAFFALPTDLATASGQVTNAVYGFTSMLLNLIRDHRPDVVAVAFDRPEPTFRHEVVEDYKAQRDEAPDILRQQMGLVREVVTALGFPILEQPGVEADDVIATLATGARDRGDAVLVVTGDRDAYQLVEDPHVRVLYNKRGVSEYALYDEAGIRERTGVDPVDYVLYAALRGDPSDNLPGVPGVGEKTAAKLVNAYGDLDGIFSHVSDQTPKLREGLATHEERVRRNVSVMALRRDVDLGVGLDELAPRPVDRDALRSLFDFLEFHSLVGRLTEAMGVTLDGATGSEPVDAEVRTLGVDAALSRLEGLRTLAGPLTVLPSWVTPGVEPAGLAIVAPLPGGADDPGASEGRTEEGVGPTRGGVPVWWLPGDVLAVSSVEALLVAVLSSGVPVISHDAKPLARWLLARGGDLRDLAMDTMLAAYLLDPAEGRYLLEDLVARYAHRVLPTASEAASGQLALAVDGSEVDRETGVRAAGLAIVDQPLRDAMEAQGLTHLHDTIEVPLVRVLAKMEHVGVRVDESELRALNQRLAAEAEALTHQIWQDAGGEFKVNSTPQLRAVLFERLGLTPQKKTKTGYSTDAASLERLRGQHPIVEHLLRYREVEKLRSTYGEGLIAEIAADGRIHATFNQTVARTGRLSSDRPNLHNIPVRTEEGRAFRRAFVPEVGCELLVADYNQIELRCIAHLAEDPGLLAAFEASTDIHTETASRVFGVAAAEVTYEQRTRAKMVSYGLAYGMEAYGLGQRLGIPTGEAQEILDAYFAAFPAVRAYMEATVVEARSRGYTETLFGRRRQLPELSSSNARLRQAAERQAMNAGIQGLAADIFKVALVRLDAALEAERRASRLVLQVHDEVLLEVPPDERSEVAELTREVMRHAYQLRVPLEVNLAFGVSWAEAK